LRRSVFASCIFFSACLPTILSAQNVTTQRNDLARTGVNPAEVSLTTSNVNTNSFGKLFTLPVDGQVYAQPLYLANVAIPSQGTHNVVYVVTEHDSVYAFDADQPGQPLWHVSLGTSILCSNIPFCNGDLLPEIGITSTPVIDPANMTLYVVAEAIVSPSSPGTPKFTLHALNVTNGAEKFGGPVTISGSAAGIGSDSVSGKITFNPLYELQRPALLLLNGNIYVSFGSHQDVRVWHGWIFGYDERTLRPTAVRCLSPDSWYGGAGLWQGGVGPAADSSGNIYVETGNGDLTAPSGGQSYGQSVVKLSSSQGLLPVDYFSPSDFNSTEPQDLDLGSGGPLLIPGTSLILAGGKSGTVYAVDTNQMGGYNANGDNIPEEWSIAPNFMFGGRIFYNSMLYLWPNSDRLRGYRYTGGSTPFDPQPAVWGSIPVIYGYKNEPAISLSANGPASGSAIIWAAYSQNGQANGYAYPGVFQAFDASTLVEIWGSEMNASRDAPGSWSKWSPPTIANGKVYLATFDNLVDVYGLLPH
jgi:hypothetical protein